MIVFAISQTQLDTLETDPRIHFEIQQPCHACRKPININIVRLGSQGDQELTQQSAQNFDMTLFRGIKSFLGMPKIIRIRLKPQQIFSLRQHFPLSAKAPCPYCRRMLDISIQPA